MSRESRRGTLELAAEYFEEQLWHSAVGAGARRKMERWGFREETLRSFGVGYAPGLTRAFLGHFNQAGISSQDLVAAGLAGESGRGGIHVRFHARIMFPVRDGDGSLQGFAGLATHLGPSWPLWLSSPDEGEGFDSGSALFGFDQARDAIAREGRALVLRDPVQVLALHQDGRAETVAVVQSPITREHTATLAAALSVRGIDYTRRDGYLGVVAGPVGEQVPDEAFASRLTPSGFTLVHSRLRRRVKTAVTPAADLDDLTVPTRRWVYLSGGLIGFGVPIALLLIAGPEGDGTGDSAALNIVIVGVATTYLLLALAVARISAQTGQPGGRRMRPPWVRGSGEVQPEGWTYHRLEEIVVGAALVSAAICLVLLMTLGGFLG